MTDSSSLALALAAALLVAVPAASPAALTIAPTVSGELLDFGPDGVVDTIIPAALLAARDLDGTLTDGEIRGILEFDLSTLPALPLLAATLRTAGAAAFAECFSLSPCPVPSTLSVKGYAGDGAVTAADFDAGTDLGATTTIAIGDPLDIDVTAFVAGLLANADPFAGFGYRSLTDGGVNLNGGIGAADDGALILQFAVPEPGTALLVSIGLVGLWRLRRRSRSSSSAFRRSACDGQAGCPS